MSQAQNIALDAAETALLAVARYLQSAGRDPHALLNAQLDAIDIATDAALDAKFPEDDFEAGT